MIKKYIIPVLSIMSFASFVTFATVQTKNLTPPQVLEENNEVVSEVAVRGPEVASANTFVDALQAPAILEQSQPVQSGNKAIASVIPPTIEAIESVEMPTQIPKLFNEELPDDDSNYEDQRSRDSVHEDDDEDGDDD